MKRYAIWDKVSPIITPVGEVLSAQDWKDRYPVANLDSITIVCGAGEINGSFFGTLGQMKDMYAAQGCDFSNCTTNEEILQKIEDFEDEMNQPSTEPSTDERIAAALEYQVMASLPDDNTNAE